MPDEIISQAVIVVTVMKESGITLMSSDVSGLKDKTAEQLTHAILKLAKAVINNREKWLVVDDSCSKDNS